MDTVRFSITRADPGSDLGDEVTIHVNDRLLQELAAEVERPWARAEGKPNLAGSYAGLQTWADRDWTGHFLTDPREVWFEDGDTVLLGCECGEWGCWPLTADVAVTETTVRWTRFRNGHREWDLGGLGPFEFDRRQYDAALEALRDA